MSILRCIIVLYGEEHSFNWKLGMPGAKKEIHFIFLVIEESGKIAPLWNREVMRQQWLFKNLMPG